MLDTDIGSEFSDFSSDTNTGLIEEQNYFSVGAENNLGSGFPQLSEIESLSDYTVSSLSIDSELGSQTSQQVETIVDLIDNQNDISGVDSEKDFGGLGRRRFFNDSLLLASLTNDTVLDGGTDSDGVTSDPAVDGRIKRKNGRTILFAGLDGRKLGDFSNISQSLDSNGNFSLDRAQVEQINGGAITEGEHRLQLFAVNLSRRGLKIDYDVVDFELNRVLYTIFSEDTRELVLVNTETDDLVKVPLDDIEGWDDIETELRSTEPRYFEGQLTPEQVYVPEGEPSPIGSDATGTINLVLDPTGAMFGKEGPAVGYEIELFGVDLGGTSTEKSTSIPLPIASAQIATAKPAEYIQQSATKLSQWLENIFDET